MGGEWWEISRKLLCFCPARSLPLPPPRLRRHNGLIKGGAKRTRIRGRPWEFLCVVHGFLTKRDALVFEWHWQKSFKSSRFLYPLIGKEECKKLRYRRGPAVKLKSECFGEGGESEREKEGFVSTHPAPPLRFVPAP